MNAHGVYVAAGVAAALVAVFPVIGGAQGAPSAVVSAARSDTASADQPYDHMRKAYRECEEFAARNSGGYYSSVQLFNACMNGKGFSL